MLLERIVTDDTEMRKAYCQALISAAEKDKRIVCIDCDLSNSCGTKEFYRHFPKRAFNVGIAEQNGCAMAAGMSVTGLIPFFHTFGAFASRRVFDQVFISCAYAGNNVKLIGCDAGISAAFNGGTHMSFEDANMMSLIPGITVIEPSDTVMVAWAVHEIAKFNGTVYMRIPRKKVYRIYQNDATFELGKANVLKEGNDVTIIACGMEVAEALFASEVLEQEGIYATVIDMFTMKPLDEQCILHYAKTTGAVVTAENGFIHGGLGGAVAELLSENYPTPLERVGVRDRFGEVGSIDYLKENFGLTSNDIVKAVKQVLQRKQ